MRLTASETEKVAELQAEYGRLLIPGEVAALFRVDPKTVSRWANLGKLPGGLTPGGHHRFREADVLTLIGAATLALNPGDPIPPERTGGMAGFVAGECGHRVAGSEWAAGFRDCERCAAGAR